MDWHIPTLPDARTRHRNRGIAPSHGLLDRFGINESRGCGLTAKPPATWHDATSGFRDVNHGNGGMSWIRVFQ